MGRDRGATRGRRKGAQQSGRHRQPALRSERECPGGQATAWGAARVGSVPIPAIPCPPASSCSGPRLCPLLPSSSCSGPHPYRLPHPPPAQVPIPVTPPSSRSGAQVPVPAATPYSILLLLRSSFLSPPPRPPPSSCRWLPVHLPALPPQRILPGQHLGLHLHLLPRL